MKCPQCGYGLGKSLRSKVRCFECEWEGFRYDISEPQRLGETVYWKPGFGSGLNRETVSSIEDKRLVEK